MFNNDASYAQTRWSSSYLLPTDPELPLMMFRSVSSSDLSRAEIECEDTQGRNVRLRSNTIHYTLPRLGYVQGLSGGDSAPWPVFVQRLPLRRDWKQGLRPSQLQFVMAGGRTAGVGSDWFRRNIWAITNTLRGVYPSWQQALELCEEWPKGVALSRNFALTGDYTLLYQGHTCGRLRRDDRITLDRNFAFVTEAFQKEVSTNALAA